jgi:hypothetical protein
MLGVFGKKRGTEESQINVYGAASLIETHRHKGDFKEF